VPVQVSGLTGVVQVAAGFDSSLALRSDGTVWAWGFNQDGQLGDGTTTSRLTPVQVVGLTKVTQIAAGRFHSLAVRSDGTTVAWGYNNHGQLGDGTTTNRTTPVAVSGLTKVTQIAGGVFHSVAGGAGGAGLGWPVVDEHHADRVQGSGGLLFFVSFVIPQGPAPISVPAGI
jgi:alpha-tubulin suppressor-like RCC1 family protein